MPALSSQDDDPFTINQYGTPNRPPDSLEDYRSWSDQATQAGIGGEVRQSAWNRRAEQGLEDRYGLDPNSFSLTRSPEVAGEIRFQKQCFLSYNMLQIHEKTMPVAGVAGTGGLNNLSSTSVRARPLTRPLTHSIIHGAPSADLTSLFVSRPDIQDLLNVKPYLLSYFMPSVRLYKVFGPDRGEAGTGTDPTSTSQLHSAAAAANIEGGSGTPPNEEIEFLFDDKLDRNKVEDIMARRRGRAGGVGLKSMNWQFLGVNPAEVENNIKLDLTLYFNDISEFEQLRESPLMPSKTYRYSDLIIYEPMYQVNANDPQFANLQRVYNPNYFRIKVVAGWNFLPNIPGNEGIFDEISSQDSVDIEKINDILTASKKVMYLNLLRHDLNFEQNGSIELTAEYQAIVEGTFSADNSDILRVQTSAETNAARSQVQLTEAGIRRTQQLNSNSCGANPVLQSLLENSGLASDSAQDLNELRESLASSRAEQQAELQSAQNRDKTRAYQQIYQNLLLSNKVYRCNVRSESLGFASNYNFGDTPGAANSQGGFFGAFRTAVTEATTPASSEVAAGTTFGTDSITATARAQANTPEGETPPEEFNARSLRRMIATARFYGSTDFTVDRDFGVSAGVGSDPTATPEETQFGAGIIAAAMPPLTEATSNEAYQNAAQIARTLVETGPQPGTVPVEFMFFGDIIDVVARPLLSWLAESNVKIIFGSFQYVDPQRPGSDPVTVPIPHIPISTELFSMWFMQEIIEPRRTTMSLRSFIRSVFNRLIVNAFGGDCVLDPAGEFTLVQEGLNVMPEFYTAHKGLLVRADANFIVPGNIQYSSLVASLRDPNNPFSLLDNVPGAEFDDYMNIVLYQNRVRNETQGRIFDIDIGSTPGGYLQVATEDAENGIYHLNLGSDRGLVKSINFTRIDQEYQVEARMASAGELNQLDQLRMRYNATVTMYGNTFFYPGQHIYINPSMVGINTVASAEALTTKLGLGGYFQIIKVENIIEMGTFETILECSWIHSGFKIRRSGRDGSCSDFGVGDMAISLAGMEIANERTAQQTLQESLANAASGAEAIQGRAVERQQATRPERRRRSEAQVSRAAAQSRGITTSGGPQA